MIVIAPLFSALDMEKPNTEVSSDSFVPGTPHFWAPELHEFNDSNQLNIEYLDDGADPRGSKSDIWSFG